MFRTADHLTRSAWRVAAAAALLLGLTACQDGGIGAGGSGDSASTTQTGAPTSSSSADVPDSPDAPTEDGGTQGTSGSGSAAGQVSFVEFGDVRYEAESVQCSGNNGGYEIGGEATGPYPGEVTIGGVFGVGSAEDPPDMAFAMFDAGQGGQWSAMSEVGGFSIGSLSSLSYDSSGASGKGTFAFHLEGDIDSASETGSFEFFC